MDGREYVHGIVRLWYDKSTGLLTESRLVDDGPTYRILPSETNIPVVRLGLGPTIVEGLTSNLMTYTTVMIAAVVVG